MNLRLCTSFLALSAMLVGCPPTDDDDSSRTIPPPAGCSFPALANTRFSFNIHFDGEDYPTKRLLDLMAKFEVPVFSFTFVPGIVTELGPDEETGLLAVTLTDSTPPPDGEPPPEDPNSIRIVYELPLGYDLPVEIGQRVAAITVLDISSGDLVAAFGLWEELEDATFELLFLAEPSDLGLAFTPGDSHPLFASVETRDRACPNLYTLPTGCASAYNLSLQLEVLPDTPEEGEEEVPGDSFELWPTEHRDFVRNGIELRVVNVWSFTFREIDPECNNPYDFTAQRASFFVTRTANAP
jgi:hypothetical protein